VRFHLRKDIEHRFEQLQRVLIDLAIISDEGWKKTETRPATMLFQDEFVLGIHPRWVAWIRAFWQQTPLSQHHRTEITGHVLMACRWLAQHYPQVDSTQPMDKGNRFSLCRLRLQRSDRLRLRLSTDPAALGKEVRKKAGRAAEAGKYVRASSGSESLLSRSSKVFL